MNICYIALHTYLVLHCIIIYNSMLCYVMLCYIVILYYTILYSQVQVLDQRYFAQCHFIYY